MGIVIPINERFWPKVRKGQGCWLWTASRFPNGYGQMKWQGDQYAHRISWRIHFGDIPKGLFVLHKCDTPSCVRPDHLFLGTNSDNMQDAINKGRKPAYIASTVKLSPCIAQEIRMHLTKGAGIADLAAQYGVCYDTIYLIKSNRIWIARKGALA